MRPPSFVARTVFFFFGVFVPLFAVVVMAAVSIYRVRLRAETNLAEQKERLLVDFQTTLISNQLDSTVEEMKFLSSPAPGLAGFLSDEDAATLPESVIEYYVSYLRRRPGYLSLSVFDSQRRMLVEVRRNAADVAVRGFPEPTDADNTDLIRRALTLEPESILVSRMDLWRGEHPVVRFVVPIVVGAKRRAYAELDYDASRLLEMVRHAGRISIGETMLLNASGYWLHSPRSEDEWGFLSPNRIGRTFAARYPALWAQMNDTESGVFRTENGIFIYRTVYPIMRPRNDVRTTSWELVYDTGRFDEYGQADDDFHWYLVSFVPRSGIGAQVASFRTSLVFVSTLVAILLAVISLLLALARKRRLVAKRKVEEEASIFMNNPAPVMRLAADGRVIKLNPAASRILGRALEETGDLFPSFSPDKMRTLSPDEPHQFEQQLQGRDYLFTAKRDPHGHTYLLYGSDITGIREIEREMRKLSAAVEQSATSILITDADGNITFANNACASSSGYRVEELIGENPRIFKSGHQPDSLYEELWRTISGGDAWHGELKNRKKNGEYYWEEVSITPLHGERGEVSGYLAVKEETTGRKAAEEQLKAAKEQAEAANRLKSEFLANMSHEIRTPMNAIVGFTDVLLDSEEDPEVRRKLGVIKRSGRHLLMLINDILDFSKIEADKMRIEPAALAIRRVIDHIGTLLHESIREKRLYFTVEFDDAVPPVLSGDEHRITQILLNVLSNAIKFTDEGGITLSCSYESGRLTMRISDTGIGIAESKLESIFSAFEQAGSSTERVYGGTGLGLAITKRLVELMAGNIEVESVVGSGSTFTITLPLPEAEIDSVEVAEEVEEVDRPAAMVEGWFAAMGRDELLQGVLRKGIRDLPEKRRKLEEALRSNDLDRLLVIAHDLKGYSGNLGMHEVYEIAKELHDGLRRGGIDEDDARRLIDRLGVTIDAIPRHFFAGRPAPTPEPPIDSAARRLRVLAAEDNEANRELLKVLLDRLGVESVIVENGKQALEALETGSFDALLLDIQMPVMDGAETIHAIRGRRRFDDLHVIAVTAHAMEGDARRYIDLGCNDYLSKPIDRAILRDKLKALAEKGGCLPVGSSRAEAPLSERERSELSGIVESLRSNLSDFDPKQVHAAGVRLIGLGFGEECRRLGSRLVEASEGLDTTCLPAIIRALSRRTDASGPDDGASA